MLVAHSERLHLEGGRPFPFGDVGARLARPTCLAVMMVALASGLHPTPARADILVTIEAPGVQSTQVAGVTTMTFNSPTYSTGTYSTLNVTSFGTYKMGGVTGGSGPGSGFAIVAPDSFGGANATQYFAVGAESSPTVEATLTLTKQSNYFGLFWMAGDSGNNLDFYNGTTFVGTENLNNVFNYLAANPATSAAYYGNPNNGQDTSEPFAYLNFYGRSGTTFNKVVFRNSGTGTGYETDNHSVALLTGSYTPSGTPIASLSAAPEPPSWAIGVVVASAAGWVAWRRRGAEHSGAGPVPVDRSDVD